MKKEFVSYLLIHIAVILFGFTAILGVLIDLPALTLVWWRVLISSLSLSFFLGGFKFLKVLPRATLIRLILIGSIMAIHWLAFFAAVKLAGASITLVCMATTCLFLSLIEPIILKKRFNTIDFLVALLVVPGMILVVRGLPETRILGVIIGLSSAFLAAVFSSLNKKYVSTQDIWQLAWIEMVSALMILSIFLIVNLSRTKPIVWWPNPTDWVYLLILGIVCTTFAHAMSLFALKNMSAFALNLVVNLEPVYGILLAAVLLGEHHVLDSKFYIGATLILAAVLSYPYVKKKIAHVVS